MKLNKGDCVKFDKCIYVVVAVVWSTVYLQKFVGDYDYTMKQLYESGYKDIEFI